MNKEQRLGGDSSPRAFGRYLGRLGYLGILFPFTALVGIFMIWPAATVLYRSVFTEEGFRIDGIARALSGTYQQSFLLSVQLGITTALIGGLIGLYLAMLATSLPAKSKLRAATEAWFAVASQMGGIPLAFAFFAVLGSQGIATRLLKDVMGIDLLAAGFSLSEFWGWVFVYLYFQVPLMFLVISPAVAALKPTWRESAFSLGASSAVYWWRIGLPVLLPVLLVGFLLLFINSFAAYATVYALSSSGGQLVPLQIRFILQGNVITGEKDLGYALVSVTMALLAASVLAITFLQRRFARWSK